MELREATRKLIAQVEDQTGCTVAIIQDDTLTTISGISMASPEKPGHLIRIHPKAPAAGGLLRRLLLPDDPTALRESSRGAICPWLW